MKKRKFTNCTRMLLAVAFFVFIGQSGWGQTTYTWSGGNSAWTTTTNWTPTRTTPATTDILIFNSGTTVTVTAVPTQTIGKLQVSASTTVNLQSGAASNILTIGGGANALSVATGSNLNNTGANAMTITLLTGSTGSISGNMTFSGAAHKLDAADASGITFNNGAIFTQGASCTGNVFTAAGTTNAIVFANGSTFISSAGSNPFGFAAPNSKVVFQTGSLFKLQQAAAPSLSGRTYANFEYNIASSQSGTGGSAFVCDNLTITLGTFNINVTGTPGHSIKGNISVANGATLTFTPASAGTVNLNGSTTQTITTTGTGSITVAANSTIIVGGTSTVDIGTSVLGGTGAFTLSSGATLKTANTSGINGSITTTTKTFDPAANYVFNAASNQSTGTLLTSAHNIDINAAGYVTLSGNVALTSLGTLTIPNNRVLDAAGFVISGSGHIDLQGGGAFKTAHAGGLDGCNTTSGATSNYASTADYIFNATGAQVTGTYLPATINHFTVTGTSALTMTNSSITCNSLTIDNGATFQIDANKTVTVNFNATTLNGAACLIIKSEGSFIDNGISGLGTARVEKSLLQNRWYYIGLPVSTAVNASSFGTISTSAGNDTHLWYWDEPGQAYSQIANGAVSLDPSTPTLRGYSVKDYTNPISAAFTGTLNTGAVSNSNLTYNATGSFQGYNLVCNPFPSAIDLGTWDGSAAASTTGVTVSNLETSVWYRTGGNFGVYNWTTGGVGTNGAQQVVPAMQAFWVRAKSSTTGSLQFNHGVRLHSSQAFYKTTTETNVFRMNVSDGTNTDETVVGFYQDAQDVFENFDSEKMFAVDDIPQLYSLTSDNAVVAINGQPELAASEERVIPMGFSTNVAGTFTFDATNLSDFDPSVSVYLEDVQLSVIQDLRQNSSYTFTSGVINDPSRFKLHFGNMITGIFAESKNNISLYAAENNIYLNTASECTVEVYNTVGEKIASSKAVKGLNKISLNTAKGIYIVKVQTGADVITEKVLIGK
jgi:hypothetical protein